MRTVICSDIKLFMFMVSLRFFLCIATIKTLKKIWQSLEIYVVSKYSIVVIIYSKGHFFGKLNRVQAANQQDLVVQGVKCILCKACSAYCTSVPCVMFKVCSIYCTRCPVSIIQGVKCEFQIAPKSSK